MQELTWIEEAKKHIGTAEIPGEHHESKIIQWWKAIRRAGIRDDETPWCAAFVGGCLEAVGLRSSRFESAKSYLVWGFPIKHAAYGCVVVFSREGGGHVGFVVGKDVKGRLMVLGGNQGNKVSIAAFDPARVVGYRWPMSVPIQLLEMPVYGIEIPTSSNEV